MRFRNAAAAVAILAALSGGSYAAKELIRGNAASTCVGRASGWQGRVSGQVPPPTYRRLELDVTRLVNDFRQQHSLPRLRNDEALVWAARAHSVDERRRGYFAHERRGDGFTQRFARYSPSVCIAENLAWTTAPGSAARIVRDWKDSAEHRHVMLLPWVRRIGVGIAGGAFGGVPHTRVVTADFSS